ncbi:MAG: hypothetical protein SPL99_04060 [Catonella sp.]|nr:hypothetical protein [Catonella sp.]
MSAINGISGASEYLTGVSKATEKKTTDAVKTDSRSEVKKTDDTAVVYTPSEEAKEAASTGDTTNTKKSTDRTAIIEMLKSDAEQRKKQMESLVQSVLLKQGKTYDAATSNMWQIIKDPEFLRNVDADTVAQAKKDIADDGYWGVEKTSDRILQFAKALSGDDSSKADELLEAFKKGYKAAGEEWGGDGLPDISKRTYDAVVKKFDAWKNGTEETTTDDATTSTDEKVAVSKTSDDK